MLRIFKKTSFFQKRKLAGFTFIEVMLVVGIMATLSTIALVSWTRSRAQQDVILAAREFQAAMRQAQGYAMTGKTDPNNPTFIPCQYQIRRSTDVSTAARRTKYELAYKYKEGDTCTADPDVDIQPIQEFTLPNGVMFPVVNAITHSPLVDKPIVFLLPSGIGDPNNTASTIDLSKGTGVTAAQSSVCVPRGQFSC